VPAETAGARPRPLPCATPSYHVTQLSSRSAGAGQHGSSIAYF
jgi:hypothetical protein